MTQRFNRTLNTKRNILFGLFNKAVTMVFPFLIRSIIIQKLGAEYLGLNSLFSSILQVLNLTELGFSNAVVYSMYKPVAENNYSLIGFLLNYYKKIYRLLGMIMFGMGLCILPLLKCLISGSYPNDINLYFVFLVFLTNTSLSYIFFGYKISVFNAYQRNDLISFASSVSLSLMYVGQIIILILFKNYYIYIILMPVFTVIQNFIIALIYKKYFNQIKCQGYIDDYMKQEIRIKISGLIVTKICGVTRNSLDNIFISAFLGLTITAIYGNYYYIMSALIAILIVISDSMLAGVGNSIVVDSKENNYKMFRKINFLYLWIVGWCTISLFCLYQPFMKLWVGSSLMFSYLEVFGFSLYFYVLEMGVIRGLFSDAAALWWENRFRAIAESTANIVLNYLLVKSFGVIGVIMATTISLLLINFGLGSQIIFEKYFKNGQVTSFFKEQAFYFGITAINCCITFYISSKVPDTSIIMFFIKIIICFVVPNIIYLVVYYKTDIYKESIEWIKGKLNFRFVTH